MAIEIGAPALTVGVALGRSGRDFSERDRQLLDLLRPHLLQAHRNAARRWRKPNRRRTA